MQDGQKKQPYTLQYVLNLFASMNEDLNCLNINGDLIRFYMYDNIICSGITNFNFNF